MAWSRFSLSGKLLLITICVILLAQLLILVPAAARFRENWLRQHVQMAETSAMLLHVITPDDLSAKEWVRIFDTLNIYDITRTINGRETYIALNENVPNLPISEENIVPNTTFGDVLDMARSFYYRGQRILKLHNNKSVLSGTIEITIHEKPLFNALVGYVREVLLSTILLSLGVGVVLYSVLRHIFVKPLRLLALDMRRFRSAPESYIAPLHRKPRFDEIGALAHNFEELQLEISEALKRKAHLATLGLAVAKISHDLRNILTAAQLMSDRLFLQMDEKTRDYLTRLVQTIDRAAELCQSTLMYGKLSAVEIHKTNIALAPLVAEVAGGLDLSVSKIALKTDIPEGFMINADGEYMFRIILNLLRNSKQALQEQDPDPPNPAPAITLAALNSQNGVEIHVRDNGTGIPSSLQANLFMPFQSSSHAGTGLGLAIVHELVEAHGGSIVYDNGEAGAHFIISLPV